MKDEEKQKSADRETRSGGSKWDQVVRKKWFWPAAYLSACAVILGTYFAIQSPSGTDQAEDGIPMDGEYNEDAGQGNENEDAIRTAGQNESLQMPVADEESVEIIGYYYDHDATAEEQQDALVYYNNMYYQNKGIDLAQPDGEAFEVTAAATGEVVKAEKDEVLGYVVDVKHENDLVTSYSSLEKLQVEEGDTVTQDSVIGEAARNLYNKDAGVHAHFEVRLDGEPLNPSDAFHQKLEDLRAQQKEAAEEPSEEESSLGEFPIMDGDESEEGEDKGETADEDAADEDSKSEDEKEDQEDQEDQKDKKDNE
ncbi:peptidoglycan DD-metalloendopeptidase family protein [Alteribacillus sp. HJP-4]|uniref:peptidoglycan DD-metalloendopeptidase family protein n=1 Tax=Alteribacillus sp. HJP-4 TaxID=2775394 RepID=UPI0035CD3073